MPLIDFKIALILAYTAKMQLLFDEQPKDDAVTRAFLLKMAAHFLDHSRPDTILAAIPREKDENSVDYLARNHSRVKMLPIYRWPKWPVPAERMPQALFGPMEGMRTLIKGEKLPPQDTLSLLDWLEPVWAKYPQFKEAIVPRIVKPQT